MKKYLDIIMINISSLAVGIFLYYLTKEKTDLLAAVLAIGISLSLGMRQYRTENDKIFKELFFELNNKYDVKFNNKLSEMIENSESNSEFKLSSKDENLIIDYLNFCAEEYLWKTKDRIPDSVWNSWENGMVYYMNKPIINQVILKEIEQKNSYYGLFDKIEHRLIKC